MAAKAAKLPAALPTAVGERVTKDEVLVVGAGGIGCELLKNLVLCGFKNITVIDLDTIDVTNLNRQFLFHRQHVGLSKAKVAKESALSFVPDANITALHDSITTAEYGVNFFKKFSVVMNALDNRAARSHVNRMCLAANVPLVESGTAGYFGQVTVIRKKATECYDCQPNPHQKTFPGCTIRNTPSEPIHCIVWSKHLFNQLFGESDPDEDVSPDAEDPELKDGGETKPASAEDGDGNVKRINTRQWAMDSGYDPKMIFQKLFFDDIKYLLTMDKLWSKRKPPVALDWDSLEAESGQHAHVEGGIRDQEMWTIRECRDHFAISVGKLKDKLKASDFKDHLVWDKDDEESMDFVAACANIRSQIFGIAQKSRFDIKSMAGNIIPAIATTNAVIAGCIVMEALKVLAGEPERCKTVYLTRKPNPRRQILVPCTLNKPNSKCYVCADKPEVGVKLDMTKVTLKTFEDRVLKGELHMVAPDAEIEGKGIVLISSEEDDEDQSGTSSKAKDKPLQDFGLYDGSILICDDFLQDYNLKIFLHQCNDLQDGKEFQIVGDIVPPPKEDQAKAGSSKEENGKAAGEPSKDSSKDIVDDDDDVVIEEVTAAEVEPVGESLRKRKAGDSTEKASDDLAPATKKVKVAAPPKALDEDDDIVCID